MSSREERAPGSDLGSSDGDRAGADEGPAIEIDPRAQSHEELCREFRWRVPARFNIGTAVCGRWAADRSRFALYYEDRHGFTSAHSFWDIQHDANRLANVLAALGTVRGDRVAVCLPPRPEAAIALVAIAQMAAIAVPLSPWLVPELLERRLGDSGAHVAIVDETTMAALLEVRDRLPGLRHVLGAGAARGPGLRDWAEVLEHASPRYTAADTAPADPAMILYPEGLSGVLLGHRTLPGVLSGYLCAHDFGPHPGDLFWSPADWASADGLWNGLLPTWHSGVPLLAYNGPFDPAKALALLQRYAVRNWLIDSSALRMVRESFPEPKAHFDLELRTLVCTGEPAGEAIVRWAGEKLGVTISETWGVSEFPCLAGSSPRRWSVSPGSLGRAYPGHRLAAVDGLGRVLPAGEIGQLAVNRRCNGADDPALGLGYWNQPAEAGRHFVGDGWRVTGCLGTIDEQGNMFAHRPERDGPGAPERGVIQCDVEERLRAHPAVAACAVMACDERISDGGLKALVVVRSGILPSPQLRGDLLGHLAGDHRTACRLKAIEFVRQLPATVDGRTGERRQEASGDARARGAG
ncbi:AMP-binding protein [Accumulibacter sp.]|uniref:AMP-binding protein n=1 Tax=Accumulibacter sp. TaxID=2053492 RepID=UPI0025F88345|nr:AMP-binding protein [Accumulibacter sp.]MCM8596851.1 AMP-binding protein [Accumulibacter sp.]MCM8624615.1 AMP-binding protein [Accumulibacter sp.]MDS4050999.1 AMP-binding protein [Accumulibacter sp.]